ncbi:hypothetical protein AVEN_225072-1 [Araneus ventricosus]|uniref:Uncharacterized protein n=1 Tax=Araneus ventricosus TaxID=182803 RepID=A0A4Y2NTC9_ARAVE|nr:hypothetical protein AVEN_225072-1 [Araneus ventricosus]
MDIFNKLRTLRNTCVLHLQWIPSHVNLKYNDIVDSLAKEGTTLPQAHVGGTYLELYSRRKALVNISWRHPPIIHGISVKAQVLLCVLRGLGKTKQLWLAYHPDTYKTLRFSRGDEKFNICTKCNMVEATPQHLLDCVALV